MPLTEPELLALATGWGERLRGRVSLQVPTHAGRLHPRDEQWLALELQKLARRSVRLQSAETIREFLATVREAVDVWHAIASCPGFTGRENPVFWRRVVSHTYRRTHLRQHGCSDEFTFFATHDFPRLRLYFEDRLAYETTNERAQEEVRHVDLVCREFFGLNDHDGHYRPSPEYLEAMARLEPFVYKARYNRIIPVAIDLPSWDTSLLYPAVRQLLSDLRASTRPRATRFRVDELSLDDMRVQLFDDAFVSFQEWLKLPQTKITHWWWKTQTLHVEATVPPSAIHAAAGLGGSVVGSLQTLLVNRHTLTFQQFRGLCAALPRARSLRHVRFSELSRRHDWAWLSFALFHPDNESSSWRELSVDICHLDAMDLDTVKVVQSEGIQSLPAVVDMAPGPGDEPLSVVVKELAKVFWDEDSFLVIGESTRLDAFGQLNSDRISVIVPAHGVGFVNRSDILDVSAQRPSSSTCLTHFRATVMTSTPNELRDWLCLIGSSTVEVIEVIDHTPLPASAVSKVLTSCLALTSLNVSHDGSLWTVPLAPMTVWKRLQTLSVSSPSPAQAMRLLNVLSSGKRGPLPRLRQLRLEIEASEQDESTLQQVAVAAADLLKGVRSITHLTLHGVTPARGRGEIQTLTYDQYRENVLSTLGITEVDLDTSSDARIALLSVLHSDAKGLPVLTTDLLRIVFAFAGREVRNAWIEL